jgi:hypothetical protein
MALGDDDEEGEGVEEVDDEGVLEGFESAEEL